MSIFGQVNPIYYIAGPMTGLPDNNYPEFDAVAKILGEQGYSVLNPVSNAADLPSGLSQEQTWQWFMRKAIRQLSYADRIMLLPGWENSKGACVEFGLAQSLGLRIEFWQSPEEKVARAVTSKEPKEGQVMSAKKYLESLEGTVPTPSPEPCRDPAACDAQGCANPKGRCEAAAQPVQQAVALTDERSRTDAELVLARLEEIRDLEPGQWAGNLAIEAIPCIRAIIAAAQGGAQ